jgi:hypothetical protein
MNARLTDKVFITSSLLVAGSTVGFPYVTGYGTKLFQFIVLNAWSVIAHWSSGRFADQHHCVVWVVAFLLNMVCFALIAVPLWLLTRKGLPEWYTFVNFCWTVFYIAMLFLLFPATDGP